MSKGNPPPGGDDADNQEDWEDILSLRVEGDDPAPPPRRPVRLSSLRPPGQPQVPTAALPLVPGQRWEAAGQPSVDMAREREREAARQISESEHARRAAEARVAELERQLADLRAQMACEREAAQHAVTGGAGEAEIEKLRIELAGARDIIRAIEEAYLASEGFPDGRPG
jgi:hypothetical protein